MAAYIQRERYENALLDCSDGTLTEYRKDDTKTYSIQDILKRWDGVSGVSLTIERQLEILPPELGCVSA